MHRRLRPWVDVTVANCEACREAAMTQERGPADGVVVIDNGIETRTLVDDPELDSRRLAGTVASRHAGELAGDQGSGESASAPPLSCSANGCRSPFISPVKVRCRSRSRPRSTSGGWQDRILLHGHVDDTPAFLRQLQIFVLCSLSEGLPHALLEAMAAGRAVVATRVGGNRELIQDGVNGLLVPPGDSRALAAAIRTLATDPSLAVRLGAAARRSVADRYSLSAMTQRFTEFYRSLSPPGVTHRTPDLQRTIVRCPMTRRRHAWSPSR